MGKVILILGLIAFTFITMLGGNPKGDRYGFRYWRDPVIIYFQQLLASLLAEKANSRHHRDHLQKQSKRAILESSSDFLLAWSRPASPLQDQTTLVWQQEKQRTRVSFCHEHLMPSFIVLLHFLFWDHFVLASLFHTMTRHWRLPLLRDGLAQQRLLMSWRWTGWVFRFCPTLSTHWSWQPHSRLATLMFTAQAAVYTV